MPIANHDRSLSAYEAFMDASRRDRIRTLADELGDTRLLHVNSTSVGGGVAELLHSLVPLFDDVGIATDWFVMDADESFFDVTKSLHNGLQGEDVPLTDDAKATYRTVTERNAAAIDFAPDIVVLHDPQPLGMVESLADRYPDTQFVWRCHIDLTYAMDDHLEFVGGYSSQVDRVIVSRAAYGERLTGQPTTVVYPSIDPLATKNRSLDPSEAAVERGRLERAGIDLDAPLVSEVSRFDPWKGQLDAIEAFERVKRSVPDAQLVLVGGAAADDPEAAEVYARVAAAAADSPDVYLLRDVPDTTVNVLQRQSAVVLQPSISEGFGLVVSEALWKRTPVVGSNVGGISLQIVDGENGYLVEPGDVEAIASRTTTLLEDADRRGRFGRRSRETVRAEFLLPRQLADCLEVFADLRRSA